MQLIACLLQNIQPSAKNKEISTTERFWNLIAMDCCIWSWDLFFKSTRNTKRRWRHEQKFNCNGWLQLSAAIAQLFSASWELQIQLMKGINIFILLCYVVGVCAHVKNSIVALIDFALNLNLRNFVFSCSFLYFRIRLSGE